MKPVLTLTYQPEQAAARIQQATRQKSFNRAWRPTYEWQTVPPGVAMPAGLQVDLPLDGGQTHARIPPKWTLQVWLDEDLGGGRWRHDVGAHTTVAELRASCAKHLGQAPSAVRLLLDAEPLMDGGGTAASLRLFERKKGLVVQATMAEPPSAPAAATTSVAATSTAIVAVPTVAATSTSTAVVAATSTAIVAVPTVAAVAVMAEASPVASAPVVSAVVLE